MPSTVCYAFSASVRAPNHYNSTMPSAAEVRSLFRQYLRLGRQFHNYNIKHYITRRAKEEFHSLATRSDAAAEAAWQRAKSELDVWKRQSVVYQLYGRKLKNVMELDAAAQRHH
eukprot:GHUV01008324.1.p1 GENE.GHUV01008324.1~~GHUV01008324.1.p1  ORF type:complete len:114 (+),score=28.29 GHUV01008324.1:158-499(+)